VGSTRSKVTVTTVGLGAVLGIGILAYAASWSLAATFDDLVPFVESHVEDLGVRFCPGEVLLLDQYPEAALSDSLVTRIEVNLKQRGCKVIPASESNLRKFENPDRSARLRTSETSNDVRRGRVAHVTITGSDGAARPWHTEVRVGWTKGCSGPGSLDSC